MLTVTHANGGLVSLRAHADDHIASTDCYARTLISTKHHSIIAQSSDA